MPAYWIVSRDVHRARAHLDFSEIGALPEEQQKLALFDAFNQIRLGAMPLPSYRAAHPNSAVTPEQLAILRNYLTSRSQEPPATVSEVQAADREYVRWIDDNGTFHSVQNTLGGVPFHPEYKTWKQIGSTERIENNTIRVVLGNDLAVKAIAENRINPWPDGAMIGKVTWHEQPNPDGVVQPGQFVQVELMIRDHEKYRTTAGWGWGRWIGMDLKPDGETLDFANTHCVDCHHAVERNWQRGSIVTLRYPENCPTTRSSGRSSHPRSTITTTPWPLFWAMIEPSPTHARTPRTRIRRDRSYP